MNATSSNSPVIQGAVSALPFVLVIAPFGILFGVVATEAGLDLAQAMGFSALVIAGAAQFTAVQLLTDQAPAWIVLAASLAVNLRMGMYSASLQPHLGAAPLAQRALAAYVNFDQTYSLSMLRFEEDPGRPVGWKVGFFLGTALPIAPLWLVSTAVGATAGRAIPDGIALDFAMPLMFLAIVGPMLKTLAHLAAAFTSVAVALLLAFLPSGIGVLFAGVAAMIVGAEVERRRA